LELKNVKVFNDRAESYPETADLVMLRAVEKFEDALGMAIHLTNPGGRVGLMIGSGQVELARRLSAEVSWDDAVQIPCSNSRELLIGHKVIKWSKQCK
jgi:16S rRNA G527 N7-methylase RsmG